MVFEARLLEMLVEIPKLKLFDFKAIYQAHDSEEQVWDIFIESLSFNIYNPEDKEWEAFQREWKQLIDLFTATTPIDEDYERDLADMKQNHEGHPQPNKVSIEPGNQPVKGEN
ncbi:hypothetical protein J1N35_005793 [Gossypium stocksii]|uniref:Uncharacterized protein n=1 Tax=Gossypium stocksii TaxID=47602 RepID=A0A9D3WFY5_9ROSI|nr:hypothetical protein J1N35_005793 [Gossypium stocksii]